MLAFSTEATASYQVELLNKAPQGGKAWGVFGSATLGSLEMPAGQAILWTSPSNTYINLDPSGKSVAYDIYGSSQVGDGEIADQWHALLWHGTAESVVDLHPQGYSKSIANAVTETSQAGAGRTSLNAPYHALLWHGTAESVVDLHNPAYSATYVWDAVGDGQVGWGSFGPANFPTSYHALLWHGTADGVVDLHPPGYRMTMAYGGGEGVQVGYGVIEADPPKSRALMWNGTAESVIELHPSGYLGSSANAAAGDWQVGSGTPSVGQRSHALAWRGTAESVIDLHLILEEQTGIDFLFSLATDVDQYGNVVGWGDTPDYVRHAIRWSIVPEPSACCLISSAAIGIVKYRRRLRGR